MHLISYKKLKLLLKVHLGINFKFQTPSFILISCHCSIFFCIQSTLSEVDVFHFSRLVITMQ